MSLTFVPAAVRKSWEFSNTPVLYHDYEGTPVLVDIEGSGRFRWSAPPSATARCDGQECRLPAGQYASEYLVAGPRPAGRLTALIGPATDFPVEPGVRVTEARGPGWITSSEHEVFVDGRPEPVVIDSTDLPQPVWFAAISSQPFDFVPSPSHSVTLLDEFSFADFDARKVREMGIQNASKPEPLTGPVGEVMVLCHLNRATLSITLPERATHLALRKTYDRFHGRQRARVLLDGVSLGMWWAPEEDRIARFGQADAVFALPRDSAGHHRLTIDPMAGAPLWSVATLTLWAFTANS